MADKKYSPLTANVTLLRLIKNGFVLRTSDDPHSSYICHTTHGRAIKAHNRNDAPGRGECFPMTKKGLQDAIDYAFPNREIFR